MLRPPPALQRAAAYLSICFGFQGIAAAQFFGLSTPADGSAVYFSTPLAQKDTTQPTYGKIFRADDSGLQLVLSRDIQLPTQPPPIPTILCATTNAYELFGTDVSSDGSVVAMAASRHCYGYWSKMDELYQTTIVSPSGRVDHPGALKLSPNGKWASGWGLYTGYLVNLKDNQRVSVPVYEGRASSGRPVANDGTVVYSSGPGQLALFHDGKTRRLPAVPTPREAIIDAESRFVLYDACSISYEDFDGQTSAVGDCASPGSRSIHIVDLATDSDNVLIGDGHSPVLTDDGERILYLSDRTGTEQVYFTDRAASTERRLTNDPFGISRAVISGDGSTVYAVSVGGRLLKIAVNSGTAREVLPRTPYLDGGLSLYLVPGTLMTLTGAGLVDSPVSTAPPLPASLGGISLTVSGANVRAARIHSVTPGGVTILLPDDLAGGKAVVETKAESSSPFAAPTVPVTILAPSPSFLVGLDPQVEVSTLRAVHEDWTALVTQANAAKPGEVLHAYAVGLGPTLPAVPFAEAAPSAEPFARLSSPLVCHHRASGASVEVLFAGLAPGMAGVYQVDFRIPASARDGFFILDCTTASGQAGGLVAVASHGGH